MRPTNFREVRRGVALIALLCLVGCCMVVLCSSCAVKKHLNATQTVDSTVVEQQNIRSTLEQLTQSVNVLNERLTTNVEITEVGRVVTYDPDRLNRASDTIRNVGSNIGSKGANVGSNSSATIVQEHTYERHIKINAEKSVEQKTEQRDSVSSVVTDSTATHTALKSTATLETLSEPVAAPWWRTLTLWLIIILLTAIVAYGIYRRLKKKLTQKGRV